MTIKLAAGPGVTLTDPTPGDLAQTYRTNPHYRQKCYASAEAWGRANPSDPFAATTALTHMREGLASYADYSVKFVQRSENIHLNDRVIEKVTMVPIEMARP